VVLYRLADGFPARLLGDCVLMLGQRAARRGGDRPP